MKNSLKCTGPILSQINTTSLLTLFQKNLIPMSPGILPPGWITDRLGIRILFLLARIFILLFSNSPCIGIIHPFSSCNYEFVFDTMETRFHLTDGNWVIFRFIFWFLYNCRGEFRPNRYNSNYPASPETLNSNQNHSLNFSLFPIGKFLRKNRAIFTIQKFFYRLYLETIQMFLRFFPISWRWSMFYLVTSDFHSLVLIITRIIGNRMESPTCEHNTRLNNRRGILKSRICLTPW